MKKKGEWEKEPRHVLNNWTALVFSLAERLFFFPLKRDLTKKPNAKTNGKPRHKKIYQSGGNPQVE